MSLTTLVVPRDSNRRWRRLACAVVAPVLVLVLVAGCGGHTASTRSVSSHTTSQAASVTATPLAARQARRLGSICRRHETAEDRNVVLQFANQGMSIFSPSVVSALRTASRDVSREGHAVRATTTDRVQSASALAADIDDEAQILDRTARLVQLPSDEAALVTVLHRRISAAADVGVPDCAGAPPRALITKAPAA
jgi:hypothetical protein